MTHGTQRIAIERNRQIELFGFNEGHDSHHIHGSLAEAALTYIDPENHMWPWSDGDASGKTRHIDERNKKHISGRIKNLVKAGALIAAEIDRLVVSAAAAEVGE